jgi:putative transposase
VTLSSLAPRFEKTRATSILTQGVLDALPKKAQATAVERLKAMPYAETQAECERQRDAFVRRYRKTDPKAVDTLLRDWDRMVTFYAFPKEHWIHLRTTNIVESPFAFVRLRPTRRVAISG